MISKAQAYARIRATLKSRSFRITGEGLRTFQGQIRVHGQPVDVLVDVPDPRFVELPDVIVLDRKQVATPALGHVDTQNAVCYKAATGLMLDMYQPGEAILRVLEEAERTLGLSYSGRGAAEVSAEFQMHWPSHELVSSLLLKRQAKPVFSGNWCRFEGGPRTFEALALSASLPPLKGRVLRGVTIWSASLPLQVRGGEMIAPATLDQLKDWVGRQPGLQHSDWRRWIADFASEKPVFVWADNAFVGFSLTLPKDLALLKRNNRARPSTIQMALGRRESMIELKRYSVRMLDIDSVTNRGQAMVSTLAGMQVAVVGGGTIGGYLARMLAQSGAGSGDNGKLTIIDDDVLSQHNIGRHMLGFYDVGRAKAEAIADELKRFHPQINCTGIRGDALSFWPQLSACSLVIDATGDWNTQNAINAAFLENPRSIQAVLHSWVFMNGAGVQTFLHLRGDPTCFRCLKPDFQGDWRYPAANSKAKLNVQPASCTDGAFVPFSVDAAVMAAALANKVSLDWAAGRPGPRLRTIKVDLDTGRTQEATSPAPADTCPACRDSRAKNA